MNLPLRDYLFLGTTQSLCPDCMSLVPAKIIVRNNRVYFRKRCSTHGEREDFVCSDAKFYDRLEYSVPAKIPHHVGVDANKGCPFDCGLCTEHEQHTCIGLVELTSSCNLNCPMCFADSGPRGKHETVENCKKAIDRLVANEGQAEVLQLSGGEPTVHPDFVEILDYAMTQKIDYIQINSNGIRFASDEKLLKHLAKYRERLEVFFQFDGFDDSIYQKLRGESLLETKLKAIEKLGEHDIHVTLATTLQAGVNEGEIGKIVQFGLERPWITGVNFQPATYSGRHFLPEELEKRITFPDVIKAIAKQTNGIFSESDFLPLPCAHPNCHSLAYAWRTKEAVIPLTQLIDAQKNWDLLANGISFTRERARELALKYLSRVSCCSGGSCSSDNVETEAKSDFFAKVVEEQIGGKNLFRVTITSFLDRYNFDVRRVMKCCTHHVLPSGHIIPFCAYNVLYRPGYVPLPKLTRELPQHVD